MTPSGRTRNAWSVTTRGFEPATIHAPTRAKARAEAIRRIRDAYDISWVDAAREIVSVTRHAYMDRALPCRHPLAGWLPPNVLSCVTHAYGGTGRNAGYRDYFYSPAIDKTMAAARYHDLFSVLRIDPGRDGRPDYLMHTLTDLGRAVAAGEVETYPRQ